MNDIIKQEEKEIIPQSESSEIISDEKMKDMMHKLLEEYDDHKQESLDMYYIFKDMVVNSGDFGSSEATKAQLSLLLKNAQDATNSKLKIFESILKAKTKTSVIKTNSLNQQNNLYVGTDRRSLILAIEELNKNKIINAETEENIEENPIDTNNDELIINSGEINGD